MAIELKTGDLERLVIYPNTNPQEVGSWRVHVSHKVKVVDGEHHLMQEDYVTEKLSTFEMDKHIAALLAEMQDEVDAKLAERLNPPPVSTPAPVIPVATGGTLGTSEMPTTLSNTGATTLPVKVKKTRKPKATKPKGKAK